MAATQMKQMVTEEDCTCAVCGQTDAYDPRIRGDLAQVQCKCGVFFWWCDKHNLGYNEDCCEDCLESTW